MYMFQLRIAQYVFRSLNATIYTCSPSFELCNHTLQNQITISQNCIHLHDFTFHEFFTYQPKNRDGKYHDNHKGKYWNDLLHFYTLTKNTSTYHLFLNKQTTHTNEWLRIGSKYFHQR